MLGIEFASQTSSVFADTCVGDCHSLFSRKKVISFWHFLISIPGITTSETDAKKLICSSNLFVVEEVLIFRWERLLGGHLLSNEPEHNEFGALSRLPTEYKAFVNAKTSVNCYDAVDGLWSLKSSNVKHSRCMEKREINRFNVSKAVKQRVN